jgi:hypothetical protein
MARQKIVCGGREGKNFCQDNFSIAATRFASTMTA